MIDVKKMSKVEVEETLEYLTVHTKGQYPKEENIIMKR